MIVFKTILSDAAGGEKNIYIFSSDSLKQTEAPRQKKAEQIGALLRFDGYIQELSIKQAFFHYLYLNSVSFILNKEAIKHKETPSRP